MHAQTGEIFHLTEAEITKLSYEQMQQRKLIPLNAQQLQDIESMSMPRRKNHMRNQLCVCGSGKKFKKCCWSKYA